MQYVSKNFRIFSALNRIFTNAAKSLKPFLINFISEKFENKSGEYPWGPKVHQQWRRAGSCINVVNLDILYEPNYRKTEIKTVKEVNQSKQS